LARPALSATRGLDIIDFLAAFPGRGFTLSEIMRATGINAASCHAILNALAERGYVLREPGQKSFTLGPVPVAVGESALRAQPLIARAREVALDLARDIDVPVLLTAAVDDEMLGVLGFADSSGRGPDLRTGERRPMVPPLGAPFVAWDDEDAIAAWLARGAHARDADFAAEQRRALELIRQRGFQVSLRRAGSPRLAPDASDAAADYKQRMLGVVDTLGVVPMPETIEPDARYDVILIAAPIFNRAGQCVFNLCLGDFGRMLSGAQVLSHAERLVTAALAVMQAGRG
jgi:DNA-binding IclR family transcriptional regulator